jgi:hypothetical protein
MQSEAVLVLSLLVESTEKDGKRVRLPTKLDQVGCGQGRENCQIWKPGDGRLALAAPDRSDQRRHIGTGRAHKFDGICNRTSCGYHILNEHDLSAINLHAPSTA